MKNISFYHEHLDYYDGQNNYELGVYEDNEIMGYVQYVIFENKITVSDILVRPERRREGFGSMLIKKMKQLHPQDTYIPSFKTDLGAKFKHKDVNINEDINRIKNIMKLI
jgi:GNAT superfamily N-acetyltransferase